MPAAGPLGATNPTLIMVMLGFVLVLLSGMACAWVWAIVWLSGGNRLLPRGEARAVPWGIGSVLLALFLWQGMQFAGLMVYQGITQAGRPKPGPVAVAREVVKQGEPPAVRANGLSWAETLTIIGIANALVVVLIPALLSLTSGGGLRDLGFPGDRVPKNLGRGVVAYFLLAPAVLAIQITSVLVWVRVLHHESDPHPVFQMLFKGLTWRLATLATLMAAVLAPLAEEFLFRGVFLGWLTRAWNRIPKRKRPSPTDFDHPWEDLASRGSELAAFGLPGDPNPVATPSAVDPAEATAAGPARISFFWPNAIVSLIFAGLHFQQWPAPIPLFFLSLGLGALYQRTGSLVAPIVLHATFNGVSTALMFLAVASGLPLTPPKAWIAAPLPEIGAVSELTGGPGNGPEKVVATAPRASYKRAN